jgi:NCS2 family nucleobase:cation symporter-2
MMSKCGFGQRNMLIVSLSLSVGLGFTAVPQIFALFPDIVKSIFAENCVAVAFVLAVLHNLLLPQNQD